MDLVDSFACYSTSADTDALSTTQVLLSDSLEGARAVELRRSRAVCLPSAIGGVAVEDSATSLQLYDASNAEGAIAPAEEGVFVTAFGPIYIDRGKFDRVLVPASVDAGAPVAAPNDAAHRLDRYACYRARASQGLPSYLPHDVKMTAASSFDTRVYDIRKPSRICLPAAIDGATVKESRGGFLCYAVKLSRGQAANVTHDSVFTADELNVFQQETRRIAEICTPLR
jgi:hypothetical protein